MDEPRTAPILPSILEEALAQRFDADAAARIRAGLAAACERPVTLRANTLRATRDEVAEALSQAGISWETVPWYADAFVLIDVRERAVWDLSIYQEGKVYLQSLSSMLPPLALAPRDGADILDMCAAPGGKTTELAALAPAAHLTACEMNAPRAEKLAYNLEKLGVRGANVMRVDARQLDEFFSFDQILLDAPCTGTGTLRVGDERAAARVTPKLLAKVTRSQRSLLDRALTVLKPGGELVYSTCSVLRKRTRSRSRLPSNGIATARSCRLRARSRGRPDPPGTAEALARAAEDGALPLLPNGLPGTLTICPTRDYEGFYLAKIRKAAR